MDEDISDMNAANLPNTAIEEVCKNSISLNIAPPQYTKSVSASFTLGCAEDYQNFTDQAIVLFDDALEEIIYLLRGDSLLRFYETPEYKKFVHNR